MVMTTRKGTATITNALIRIPPDKKQQGSFSTSFFFFLLFNQFIFIYSAIFHFPKIHGYHSIVKSIGEANVSPTCDPILSDSPCWQVVHGLPGCRLSGGVFFLRNVTLLHALSYSLPFSSLSHIS